MRKNEDNFEDIWLISALTNFINFIFGIQGPSSLSDKRMGVFVNFR
jgi:hypothetical protein